MFSFKNHVVVIQYHNTTLPLEATCGLFDTKSSGIVACQTLSKE